MSTLILKMSSIISCMDKPKLEWDEKYSVKVKLIDDQHKFMLTTINQYIFFDENK